MVVRRAVRFLGKPSRERRIALRSYLKRGLNRLLRGRTFPLRLEWGFWWLCGSDWLDDVIFAMGAEDRAAVLVFRRLVKPGMTVVDVGAHHGFYTLTAATLVGDSGRVICFEPSPRELERLRRHLRINRVAGRVEVVDQAVADFNGRANLFLGGTGASPLNSLRPDPSAPDRSVRVEVDVVALDDHLSSSGLGSIDLMKVDVEGAELAVLRGSRRILGAERRPIIMCEVVGDQLARFGHEPAEMGAFLERRGFSWFRPTQDGRLVPAHGPLPDGNWFAVPVERASEVETLVGGG